MLWTLFCIRGSEPVLIVLDFWMYNKLLNSFLVFFWSLFSFISYQVVLEHYAQSYALIITQNDPMLILLHMILFLYCNCDLSCEIPSLAWSLDFAWFSIQFCPCPRSTLLACPTCTFSQYAPATTPHISAPTSTLLTTIIRVPYACTYPWFCSKFNELGVSSTCHVTLLTLSMAPQLSHRFHYMLIIALCSPCAFILTNCVLTCITFMFT